MAAAAFRPMLAAAREEAAIITSDVVAGARSTATTEAAAAARQAGSEAMSLNPLAIREAAEASARQAVNKAESSIFSSLPGPGTPTTAISTSTSTASNTVLSEAGAEVATSTTTSMASTETTMVGKLLQNETGVSVKEAMTNMTNAGETGLQTVAEQTAESLPMILEAHQPETAAALRAHELQQKSQQ